MGLLEEKRAEKRSKEAEKASKEAENAEYEAILERLRTAKEVINSGYDNLQDLRAEVKKDPGNFDSEWKGNKFTEYEAYVKDDIYGTIYYNYQTAVNDILDELCDLITEYENRIYENESAIGWLKSAINSLANAIEKLLNDI